MKLPDLLPLAVLRLPLVVLRLPLAVLRLAVLPLAVLPLLALPAGAQTALSQPAPLAASARTAVPALVPYSGVAVASDGKPLSGAASATFLIYADEAGGEPLFAETQAIAPDAAGKYTVQLGATLASGLPADLFATGEARWLEVQIAGQAPSARALLASVPYALKAADAATLGGLPASAYALAGAKGASSAAASSAAASSGAAGAAPDVASDVTTTGGAAGYLAEFSGATTIVDSPLFVLGSDVGVGTATPTATLDVNGTGLISGLLTVNGGMTVAGSATYTGPFSLPAQGTATATQDFASQVIKVNTSAYNSSTKAAVSPRFEVQAFVTGQNTANPGATLDVLASTTTAQAVPTGFSINTSGIVSWAPGQTFPGTGAGTITGVAAGAGLTGGGTSGAVSLAVDPTQVPLLAASTNAFAGSETVAGSLSAGSLAVSGTASAGTVNATNGFELGGTLFAFGSANNQNAFLGFAGNSSTTGTGDAASATGTFNTASGYGALYSNTTGDSNTASGSAALHSNTTGYDNAASGYGALYSNTAGDSNTASGSGALYSNTTGSNNVGLGFSAGIAADGSYITGSNNTLLGTDTSLATGTITNATALGAYAEATQNNTLVLGCVAGTNNCPSSVSVGIGTTAPTSLLQVAGTVTATSFVGNGSGLTGVAAATNATELGGLAASAYPQLAASNTFTGNQTVNGNVSAGTVNATSGFDLGGELFAFASTTNGNTFLGFTGNTTATGGGNTASGFSALGSDTTGADNTASGLAALYSNATGSYNTASGYAALNSNTTGFGNTASGFEALTNNTKGNYNTASGADALYQNTTGNYNAASGSEALAFNTTGGYNTASGYEALYSNTTGGDNTAGGFAALSSNTTGGGNTAVGYESLEYAGTGSNNTALGFFAGVPTSGGALGNTTALGYSATVNQSNSLVLGNTSATAPGASYVNVGIGTATPRSILEAAVKSSGALGPVLTLTNTGGNSGAASAVDFNTYAPSTSGTYNPAARIAALDDSFGDDIAFLANKQGAANQGLQTNMTVYANGNVTVRGVLSAAAKNFQIDDPLDPQNKYLVHTSVESSEMMNIYSGNVVTDELGLATVTLPAWFEAENTDFRYQLTVIGRKAQAWIAEEVGHGQFKIASDATNTKISWQITGVRQDSYAKAHPLVVEQTKPASERAGAAHPEFGQPASAVDRVFEHPALPTPKALALPGVGAHPAAMTPQGSVASAAK